MPTCSTPALVLVAIPAPATFPKMIMNCQDNLYLVFDEFTQHSLYSSTVQTGDVVLHCCNSCLE